MYALNESLAFLLNRTGVVVASAFTLELKERGLSLSMWRVLAALWGAGGQTLSGLAEVASIEVSTLSRQVGSLVEKGLVHREQSGLHWRSVNIGLTAAGRDLVEQLVPAVARHEAAALDDVSVADARRLKLLLDKIYANLIALDQAHLTEKPGRRKGQITT